MQSGAGDFSCSVAGSSLLQPVFAFGPILLNLAADGKFGIAGSESNTSAIDVPAVGYQYTAKENLGLSPYTDGSWSTLHKATFSSGAVWEDPSSPFTVLAKASGDVEAYTATRFGFSVSLGSKYVTLLKALLFTEKNYGKADFSFDAQTSALTTTTYSGPVWDAKIGAELDFDPSFSGAVTQVMGEIRCRHSGIHSTKLDQRREDAHWLANADSHDEGHVPSDSDFYKSQMRTQFHWTTVVNPSISSHLPGRLEPLLGNLERERFPGQLEIRLHLIIGLPLFPPAAITR